MTPPFAAPGHDDGPSISMNYPVRFPTVVILPHGLALLNLSSGTGNSCDGARVLSF